MNSIGIGTGGGGGYGGFSPPKLLDLGAKLLPKASDGCPKHTDVSWHGAGFIRCHFIMGVFDPCACTHEDYAITVFW